MQLSWFVLLLDMKVQFVNNELLRLTLSRDVSEIVQWFLDLVSLCLIEFSLRTPTFVLQQ